MRHSCGAFLWDTFVGHSWWTLLCGTATEVSKNQPSHLKAGVLHKTSSKSHTSRLQNEHCARDCFQNSLVKSPKRAWRTRFSQKTHTSSLYHERFVRDVLQKSRVQSHVKVSKPSISHETSSKSQAGKPIGARTHQAALPSSFAIPAPPNNARPHANPNVTATFTSTTTRNLTVPCACHKNLLVHTSNTHKVLRHEMSPPSHLGNGISPRKWVPLTLL